MDDQPEPIVFLAVTKKIVTQTLREAPTIQKTPVFMVIILQKKF